MRPLWSLDDLREAAARVHALMPATPQYPWPKLARRTGCQAWVKHENHTPTGAFKIRGGIIYMEEMARRGAPPGVISATRGNHGQSISLAASRAGIPATIYVPHGNSVDQNAAMLGFGATLVEFGDDFDQARVEAARVASERGLHFVPSFHEDLVRGVASYALELFAVVSDLDVVYVAIGMGSGICGLINARDVLGLRTEIVGVVSEQAPAMALSVAAGQLVTTPTSRTFADGIATRVPHELAYAIITQGSAAIVQVSEDEIAEAVRSYFDDTHQVAEGAGAAPLAALMKERSRRAGQRVGLILTGGNIERARYRRILDGATPSAA
jgi:threonine dehydratase